MGDFLDTNEMIVDDDNTEQVKASATKRKGRGFGQQTADYHHDEINQAGFESVENNEATGKAQRSVEGWIILVTGLHEEAPEDDVKEKFAEFGDIKSLHLNLDRRTGFVKGYALIEYETFKESKAAVDATNGTEFLGKLIQTDFAFIRGQSASKSTLQNSNTRGRGRGGFRRGAGR
ncbi:hypothetical protein SmJEL517_g04371 [Synchytrium microbalum]|uniref:RNA-binding protein 8A n=1 Tax=Synchytrium microbalum TaxID=1806994 RepID=A0A507C0H9_9FUNG|nr:uncharacterized protein SmJEL517_g04371 [Synchytrium microbalum]TPX32559.1 hypothetical protein SmJEL517_g04371 [Synchytrium microbalum]